MYFCRIASYRYILLFVRSHFFSQSFSHRIFVCAGAGVWIHLSGASFFPSFAFVRLRLIHRHHIFFQVSIRLSIASIISSPKCMQHLPVCSLSHHCFRKSKASSISFLLVFFLLLRFDLTSSHQFHRIFSTIRIRRVRTAMTMYTCSYVWVWGWAVSICYEQYF